MCPNPCNCPRWRLSRWVFTYDKQGRILTAREEVMNGYGVACQKGKK
mgnify:CR=1 FL=1